MDPSVIEVKYESRYKLLLTFSNNEVRKFDFSSYLDYPVYTALTDESFCRKAKVFNGTVAWNDEIDFDYDTLYLESKELAVA